MTLSLPEVLTHLVEHREIVYDDMLVLFRRLMAGEWSLVEMAAFITALRVKKETIGEITAAAQIMRELVTPVMLDNPGSLVDVCGTGGDGSHTFNISTAAMFVAAAGGAQVAKHGGRSVSSLSGSADVLEALGVAIDLPAPVIAQCIDQTGVGFMFAPNHHSAMKYAAPVRKALGIRTLFNILGPLTNPAGAKRQLMGVFHADLVGILVRVLQRLGSEHVMVVHGHHGLDELSLDGPSQIGECVDGHIHEYSVVPEQAGLQRQSHQSLMVRDVGESRQKILEALSGKPGAARDIVLLNAGAALYVGGQAQNLRQGVENAAQLVDSGQALRKLEQFVHYTRAAACSIHHAQTPPAQDS